MGDLDLNGYSDIIVSNMSYSLTVLFNSASGINGSSVNYGLTTFNPVQYPLLVSASDINNDGKTDVFVGFDNGEPSQVLLNCVINTGLENSSSENHELNLYPNPASEELNIDCSNLKDRENITLQIFNYLGQLVKNEKIKFGNESVKIYTHDLPEGFYVVSIKTKENYTENKSLIISR